MKRILSTLVFGALLAVCSFAQDVRATISGTITDPSGAPMPGVQVKLASLDRGTVLEATSNEAGLYRIQFLLPGGYTMTVEKAGFKKFVRTGIVLAAADHPALDIKLDLGQTTESVTVTGDVSLLQTETSTRSATIEARAVEDIPTAGRNLYQFQYTLPGVIKTSRYMGSMELYAFGNINGVSIGGGRTGENETVIDGVANTKMDRGVVYAPALNGTQEVTVQTNSYDAQYGRLGGGVTVITTKSGTNDFHGQLFEFFKNDKLNANDWIANKYGEEKSPMRNNTFGFEVDGPVRIPKLFDGRNKAFFMLSLEGLREHIQSGQVKTMASADERTGNFSKTLNGSGQLVNIYDPLTTRLEGGKYVRTPFAGNVIPSGRINPVSKNVTGYIPLPNAQGDGSAHINNYGNFSPAKNGYNSWLGRMDLKLSQKSSVAFRYGETPWINWSKVVWGTNAAEPSGEWPSQRISRNWGADWTYTLNPTMVFSLRAGLARYEGFGGNTFAAGFDPRQLGFSDALVKQFTTIQFPRFNMGTYTEVGASTVTSYETHDTWSVAPTMNWILGRHVIKYGGDFRRYNRNQLGPGAASGNYSFSKGWTQADPQRGDAVSGNEFASFLLGYPSGGSVDRNIDPAYRSHYYSLFVQDDYKLSRNLTVNLGLRWDYESPAKERFNRMVRAFDRNVASPIASQVKGLDLKGGVVYATGDGVSAMAFDPKRMNFQPRVGFAWKFAPKTVMRGGYGLNVLGQSVFGPATGYSQPTPLIASTDGNLTPAASLSDPFPASIYPNGLLKAIGNSQGLSTNLGQGVTAQYLDRPLPLSHQFSLGFQHELPAGMVVDLSYVGNLTRRLPVNLPLNFIPLNELEKLPVAQRAAYFTERIPNPMAGLLPNSGINTATVPRSQLLLAYPQYTGVTLQSVPIGTQDYHSIQVRLTRRFNNGIMYQAAFTRGKTLEAISVLNNQDINLASLTSTPLEKRIWDYDMPNKFTFIGIYELPFGKGRKLFSGANALANGIIGGWNLSGQWLIQSGFPMNFPNAAPLRSGSPKLSDSQRETIASNAGRSYWDVSYDKWFDTSYFPKQSQQAYTMRDFPTRFPDVRAQNANSVELSVYKQFTITERVKWQIRADAYNALNHPWFGQPQSVDVTNSRFGYLNADMNNETRIVSLIMKITF
ncbi:MAG: TonB-dependent receptor [Acidobacteria bacterium]|nr:TonB-dependent receptor [Acidobacteriota bacterium]